MSLRNCSINFSKPVFFPGETVSGKVNLKLEKNKLCSALILNILGEAYCIWSETQGTRKMQKGLYYKASEKYFETFNNLMAEQETEVGTSDLLAGDHSFDFAFVLPENLPPSLNGAYGSVRYVAKVVLKRDYKVNLCYQTEFTVLSHFDLNLKPGLNNVVQKKLSKKMYFFFSKKGTIYMTVKIPFSGYVSGQYIPIICHLKNDSKVKTESVKAELIKNITYYAQKNEISEVKKISRSSSGETCCGEERTHDMPLYVPPTPTTTISTNCSIIDATYNLKITTVVSGIYGTLSCTIPITIGTVPLVSNFYLPVDDQPSTSTSCVSKEPPACLNMDPPLYEEVVMDKKIEEDFKECD